MPSNRIFLAVYFQNFIFLAKRIYSSKSFWIPDPFYNLNSYLLSLLQTLLLTSYSNWVDQY